MGANNIIGMTFGRLTVVKKGESKIQPNGSVKARWWCRCSCGNEELVLKVGHKLKSGHTKTCGKCNFLSFADWGINEFGEDFLDLYWDFDLNKINPYEISYQSNINKIWIKCQSKDYHESYLLQCNSFVKGGRCPYCVSKKIHKNDSFAQYGFENIDNDFLKKYWDYEKNLLSPWEIAPKTGKRIWIKCQKTNYHGSYQTTGGDFNFKNARCPYCSHMRIHEVDSLGSKFPQIIKLWSDKNLKSPYEYAPCTDKKVWLKCVICNDDYEKRISYFKRSTLTCSNCPNSRAELIISNFLKDNNIIYEMEYDKCDSLESDLGNPLRFDFAIFKDCNKEKLICFIEYDGIHHYEKMGFQTTEQFYRAQYHDKLKNKYCKDNNIKLLRIPYWDFDNIEEILLKYKLIAEIAN